MCQSTRLLVSILITAATGGNQRAMINIERHRTNVLS